MARVPRGWLQTEDFIHFLKCALATEQEKDSVIAELKSKYPRLSPKSIEDIAVFIVVNCKEDVDEAQIRWIMESMADLPSTWPNDPQLVKCIVNKMFELDSVLENDTADVLDSCDDVVKRDILDFVHTERQNLASFCGSNFKEVDFKICLGLKRCTAAARQTSPNVDNQGYLLLLLMAYENIYEDLSMNCCPTARSGRVFINIPGKFVHNLLRNPAAFGSADGEVFERLMDAYNRSDKDAIAFIMDISQRAFETTDEVVLTTRPAYARKLRSKIPDLSGKDTDQRCFEPR